MRQAPSLRLLFVVTTLPITACGAAENALTLDASTRADAVATMQAVQPDVWTWIPVDGALCADGSGTGFAVNLAANSNRLLVLYEGGGACYDAVSCYVLHTAAYVTTGYTESTFASVGEEQRLQTFMLTNRNDPNNVFADVNYAYVPYCTGDLHDGTRVMTYPGMSHPTYHVGFTNGQKDTQVLANLLPHVDHVWVSGYSAGGFGATFHFADTQAQFPQARVDLIDDSGEAFPGAPHPAAWGMQLPDDCTTCDPNEFASLVRYYSGAYPTSRFATLSFTDDSVLSAYFHMSEAQFMVNLRTYEAMLDTLTNSKYFVYTGRGHVLMRNENRQIGSATLHGWLGQMVSDDPNWVSHRD